MFDQRPKNDRKEHSSGREKQVEPPWEEVVTWETAIEVWDQVRGSQEVVEGLAFIPGVMGDRQRAVQ